MPIILVGNKCELEENRQVPKIDAQTFADQNGFLFLEASAKCDINISEVFDRFTKHLLKKIRPKSGVTRTETCIHRSPRTVSSRSQFIDANSNSFILGENQHVNSSSSFDIDIRKVISDVSNFLK